MMYNSGRDSGYCENANSNFGDAAGSSEKTPFFNSKTPSAVPRCASLDAEKCIPSEDVHLIIADEGKCRDHRITGSSCRALKHAVSNLTRLDDFICEKIGDGFFSEVYKVTHRVTTEVMVLKMNLLRSNRANMLKEVQLMNRLSHPNILKFMGVCVHEGQLHALTEYINGGSLEQLIQSSQELTYSVRMKLALDIAKGMQYLHSQDVFHRDLTSKNVLIKKSEDCLEMTAVVGDFGLAAKIPKSGIRLPTVGSPYWMSPECLKGQFYDERSDIFSYGIVLCELIARLDADPDILPRTSNFGLDYLAFVEICSQLPKPPPPEFLKLAFSCCNLEPKNRPLFADIAKLLEKIVKPVKNAFLANGCTLTEARSEEVLPCPSPTPSILSESKNSHRKLVHRRSLSEDIGLIVFPAVTAPSDKARCHWLSHSLCQPPLKRVGESMCQEDPHYKPTEPKSNPFAALSKLKGVKKILAQTNSTDLFSSCFELPSPFHGADERKPSFYADIEYGTKTSTLDVVDSKHRAQLPYANEKSSSYRRKSAEDKPNCVRECVNSSIVIEPVIKPSEIKKCSSTSNKFKSSSNNKEKTIKDKRSSKTNSGDELDWQSRANASPVSSSSSSSSCNTSSATLRLKDDHKSKNDAAVERFDKLKPSSLPSSPTFCRKRATFSNGSTFKYPAEEIAPATCAADSYSKKICSSLFLHPLYKSRGCLTDLLADSTNCGNVLRSCSSSSNISVLEECSNVVFLPTAETQALNLRRRGSCESGFYSSVGEDFCVPDSNSEDNSTPVYFNGRYPCTMHHHTASSVYTDSSEDVSSLASSETPIWDDKQKPQHISKIVEYFEGKQTNLGNSPLSHKWDFFESSNKISSLHASIRRNWIQGDGQPVTKSSLDYYTRRKLFEKPFTGGSHVLSKRSANQRLLICEGAVKSKLPIFDKK
ncbi:serine/threonine-protein kinase unc-51 isoform X2 [Planococcus citri]|uniref:serine/threonine-protein kinase unc-51 isoform X2 n=1 Tax=Planococcus citri TaxID=170843 RepID=UPI0031F8A3C4